MDSFQAQNLQHDDEIVFSQSVSDADLVRSVEDMEHSLSMDSAVTPTIRWVKCFCDCFVPISQLFCMFAMTQNFYFSF